MRDETIAKLEETIKNTLNRVSTNGATIQDNEFLKIANDMLNKPVQVDKTEKMLNMLLDKFMNGNNNRNIGGMM